MRRNVHAFIILEMERGDIVRDISASYLECTSLQSGSIISITLDDVICILPEEHTGRGYKLLYLQKFIGSQGACSYLESTTVTCIPSTVLSAYLLKSNPRHLQECNVHVVISTASGTGTGKNLFHHVLRPFLSHLQLNHYRVHETNSPGTISDLARSTFLPRAHAGVPQTIILLSGDGGLLDIINVFHTSTDVSLVPPNIALMPTGTGNAMANSIGLLAYPKSALVALIQGKSMPLPTFAASFSPGAQHVIDEGRNRASLDTDSSSGSRFSVIYGAVVASWGIHAALVADSDTAEYRRFGADRFKMAAKELLYPSDGAETHRYNGVIDLIKYESSAKKEAVQTLKDNEHMYMLATLVSKLEKDFVISPGSLPLDGRLKLIHFAPVPPDEATRLLGLAYQQGAHVHEEAVTYEDIVGFKITFRENSEKWRRVCIDGKIIAIEEDGWMEVRKESRHLLSLIACISDNN